MRVKSFRPGDWDEPATEHHLCDWQFCALPVKEQHVVGHLSGKLTVTMDLCAKLQITIILGDEPSFYVTRPEPYRTS